ncbi:MAG: calcium/sodium antiporter [Paraglaciecola sp.]|uniref:calcium/sodium antiporter n=1 Tax=Paraglaciecola sp. TaxID=1920173 RepID=UPI00273DE476|nr:calcium/sodium antiporter [Paraglaciecola sp.]MDP5030650.1 calcium/sodium antiporter [Paraglaciecola sp.]MDP5041541.1 calcium/sodium antiporter [Paraglaciecola sp.]MDP5130270.1 calcium/sodium antiporter [Paraglaciecola sp.]
MFFEVFLFLVWLAVLSFAADRFVYGAAAMAKNFGISPMVIGLTIVAMGSSAPEIVVSATASLNGNINTAIGNAIGSNITNIALVLGLTALLKPLLISSSTLKREMPVLLFFSLLATYMLSDLFLSRTEGLILIVFFFAVIGALVWMSFNLESNDPLIAETESEIPTNVPTFKAIFWLIMGLILLPLSANFMVDSAVVIAKAFGLSDLVIGLTIIAIGTSLPELAASIAGVLKNEDDMALGNIIGSNIFNILAVMAMPGLIAPGLIDEFAAHRDVYIMLGLNILLILMSFNLRGIRRINRIEGLALIACFAAYQFVLFG